MVLARAMHKVRNATLLAMGAAAQYYLDPLAGPTRRRRLVERASSLWVRVAGGSGWQQQTDARTFEGVKEAA